VPEWRIVPESLWIAVQTRNAEVSRKFGASRLGGMSRTENARSYLFSGLMRCGECDSRLVIISGQGKRGYPKYGCPSHRYRGVCGNALTIRRDRLEAQLLNALEQRITDPQLVEYIFQRFNDELRKRMKELEHWATRLDDLRSARQQLQGRAQRVADAIANAGHSATLLSTLATIEAQIAETDQQLKLCDSTDISSNAVELREFMYRSILKLETLLRSDPITLKPVLARHLDRLTLKPLQTSHGAVYEVSGVMSLTPEGSDVMQMVARDGVEPPTPAFSGLRTTSLSLPFFNNLTLQSGPSFCDHSVTSADVRLSVGPNVSRAACQRPVDLRQSQAWTGGHQNANPRLLPVCSIRERFSDLIPCTPFPQRPQYSEVPAAFCRLWPPSEFLRAYSQRSPP
jgi:hypothetical protein